MRGLQYLDLCSGITAATQAFHVLGWKPVAFSETDPFAKAVLKHRYPNVPNLGDLKNYRKWSEKLLSEADVVIAGTPCQAFSFAGDRKSLKDERGELTLDFVNLFHHVNEVRKRHGRLPAIAVWENVPGALNTKDNAFGCLLGGLMGCPAAPETESGRWHRAGFYSSKTIRVGYRVLDAKYFGVPQQRRRIFLIAVPHEVVGHFGEQACPSEILALRRSVLGRAPTC